MPHLVLIGDSILDNSAYTQGGPSVVQHVADQLPPDWAVTLCAVDGSTTEEIPDQLARLPKEATHLLLSIGGNNALLRADLLETPVTNSSEAFLLLRSAALVFEQQYKKTIQSCLAFKLPLVICTIYHGNFADPQYQQCVALALTAFNDVIIRQAIEQQLQVIDLRAVCTQSQDYANPLEPSSTGGAKIAASIVKAVTTAPNTAQGARLMGNPTKNN